MLSCYPKLRFHLFYLSCSSPGFPDSINLLFIPMISTAPDFLPWRPIDRLFFPHTPKFSTQLLPCWSLAPHPCFAQFAGFLSLQGTITVRHVLLCVRGHVQCIVAFFFSSLPRCHNTIRMRHPLSTPHTWHLLTIRFACVELTPRTTVFDG